MLISLKPIAILRFVLNIKKAFVTIATLTITDLCFCQTENALHRLSNSTDAITNDEINFKKTAIGFEITASVLSLANVTRDEGTYRLQSRRQPAYSAGIIYIYNLNRNLSILTGLHGVIAKWNYYANIPPQDGPYNVDGAPIIWDKEIWGAIKIPLLIEANVAIKNRGNISFGAGLALNYSGFVSALSTEIDVHDPGNQAIKIFSASFSQNNNYKPWISFVMTALRSFVMKDHNLLSVGIKADVSTTYFFNGNYLIDIPNHPYTSGTYKINGTSIGISVQYILNSKNKRRKFR